MVHTVKVPPPPGDESRRPRAGETVLRVLHRLRDSVTSRCRYTVPGLWTALVFGLLSFTPSLLPRPASFQGALAGIDGALGYGLGLVGAWIWREYADRDLGDRRPASGEPWRSRPRC